MKFGAVVCAVTLLTTSALRAELTAFWRNNPITPAAIADDPALAGMQSWSLMVTNTQAKFAAAGMRATLPQSWGQSPIFLDSPGTVPDSWPARRFAASIPGLVVSRSASAIVGLQTAGLDFQFA